MWDVGVGVVVAAAAAAAAAGVDSSLRHRPSVRFWHNKCDRAPLWIRSQEQKRCFIKPKNVSLTQSEAQSATDTDRMWYY